MAGGVVGGLGGRGPAFPVSLDIFRFLPGNPRLVFGLRTSSSESCAPRSSSSSLDESHGIGSYRSPFPASRRRRARETSSRDLLRCRVVSGRFEYTTVDEEEEKRLEVERSSRRELVSEEEEERDSLWWEKCCPGERSTGDMRCMWSSSRGRRREIREAVELEWGRLGVVEVTSTGRLVGVKDASSPFKGTDSRSMPVQSTRVTIDQCVSSGKGCRREREAHLEA